jgi:hypothetical protein
MAPAAPVIKDSPMSGMELHSADLPKPYTEVEVDRTEEMNKDAADIGNEFIKIYDEM